MHSNGIDNAWDLVYEFHKSFDQPIATHPTALGKQRALLRAGWMNDEVEEFMNSRSPADQVDAMIDLIYFALGTLVEMGVKPGSAFESVHNCNMKKLWHDGKPRFDSNGKIIKPENWKSPDDEIKCLIEKAVIASRPTPAK